MSTAFRGGFVDRRVGPYRMFGYSMLADADDVIDVERAAEAARLVDLIESRDAHDLLRPLRDVCAPAPTPSAAVLLALQVVEGIYGPMGWPVAGLAFDERLARAGVPDELVGWMCGPPARTRDGPSATPSPTGGRCRRPRTGSPGSPAPRPGHSWRSSPPRPGPTRSNGSAPRPGAAARRDRLGAAARGAAHR